jgi:hypothetical protein
MEENKMLGELLGEFEGKIIGQRVLPSISPMTEISVQQSGKLMEIDTTDILTYCCVVRPDGTLFGEGHGITMTKEGDMATWKGQGTGKFTGKGSSACSFRGAIYFQSSSEKLSCLNCIAVIYEYEVDDNGNTHSKLWEWK